MANWSGTYTISAGTSGTSTGSNTSTTFNNSGATWPTGANGLTNFWVRILAGTGAGQIRQITGNTATQLTVSPAWSVTPDGTSVYEIVLILGNGDHVTGNLTLTAGIITELADSATVLVDGSYVITLQTSVIIRWGKSPSTLVTFEANSRTSAGRGGFWQYIYVNSPSVTPQVSYIRARDCERALLINPSAGVGDGSTIHHIWGENCSVQGVGINSAAVATDMRIVGVFCRLGSTQRLAFGTNSGAFTQTFNRCWLEGSASGTYTFVNGGVDSQVIDTCVFREVSGNSTVTVPTGKTFAVRDSYFTTYGDAILNGQAAAAAAGTYRFQRNVLYGCRGLFGSGTSTASMVSAFNDISSKIPGNFAYTDFVASAFMTATSDNDYISGQLLASPENVDTSTGTTSSATPQQYKNLTASRTNAKAVRNHPQSLDNVVVGTPTGEQVTFTFDCTNGAVSGQGSTTVNVDSNAGTATLNVVSSTGFEVGETIEIGYGTARFETAVVASTGAGTIGLTANLTFTHTAAQADTVKKTLRHYGLPFVVYGTTSGAYTGETALPPSTDWGLIWTGIRPTWNGSTYEFKQRGHSVLIDDLTPGTTYYALPCVRTPTGELLTAGSESTFTTAGSSLYTDPGVANVRLGTTYQFNSATPNRTGTVRVPTAANVKTGYQYDASDGVTGTYDGSDRWTDPGDTNVRSGTAYKANSTSNNKTGRVVVPTAGEVKVGTAFETDGGTTGTYDGSERYTDIDQGDVLLGVNWRYNSLTNNRFGSFTTPTTAQIAAAVWGTDISGYGPNTAGRLLYRVYKRLVTFLGLQLVDRS